MTTVFGRVFPRYRTEGQDPPTDFPVGELVVNLPASSLYFKRPDGEVLIIPGLEAVLSLIGQGGEPGPIAPTGPRILFANNESVLYDQRQLYQAGAYTLPGNTMGLLSRLDVRAQVYADQGSNSRVILKFGGVELANFSLGWGRSYIVARSIRNRGALDSQITDSWGGNPGPASNVYGQVQALSVDTSEDVEITLEVDNSGGNSRRCRVDSFEVLIWP